MARTAEEIRSVSFGLPVRPREVAAAPQDLFQDLASLSQMMVGHVQADRHLDAFLAAAGMCQIVDDYLHRDIGHLRQVARHAPKATLPTQGIAGLLGAVAAVSERGVSTWRQELVELVQRLATRLVIGQDGGPLGSMAESVAAQVERAPAALRTSVVRLPACFTAFDQQPEDCQTLARSFADRWPDRGRPLAVIGVRTSGSYLAPLCAAYLKKLGFQRVDLLTWRPGQRWAPAERKRLEITSRGKGLALVVDDPPTSGDTLAEATEHLRRRGMPFSSIVLLFQVFDSPSWWPWARRLEPFQKVIFPWDRWAIQDQLRAETVREALSVLLADRAVAVNRVDRLPLALPSDPKIRRSVRGHVHARYRVEFIERRTGRPVEQDIYVKGTGLGYFGEQSFAIARQLNDFVPHVYGLRNGLMFRQWVPEGQRYPVDETNPSLIAPRLAAYVAARHRRLTVDRDVSQDLVGRDALWEQCAHLMTRPFGRLAAPVRILLRGTFKKLLTTPHPSLVDGSPGPAQWFLEGDKLLKVDFDENVFWKATPGTYDAIADLAGAAVHFTRDGVPPDRRFGSELRETYARLTNEPISPERWFLYQLLNVRKCQERYLYDYGLSRDDDAAISGLLQALGPLSRDLSRLFEGYFGDLFLGDSRPRASGPFCAIDIDGVLETSWLSFSAITPAGTLALRSLSRHGYRTLLATGRSLEEVRERCAAYRLPGGVAEYGAVIYNHLTGGAHPLLSPAQQSALEELREGLQRTNNVHVDPSQRFAVRAYRIVNGQKSGLSSQTVEAAIALTAFPEQIRAVAGKSQTDFMVAGIDKGTGLQALTAELGRPVTMGPDSRILALAVGDSETDTCMFPLSERSVLSRRHQAGLLDAVSQLIGHAPGGCAACQPPVLSGDAQFLVSTLGAQDLSRWGKLLRALALRRHN